jgi:hypothetical protein
MRRRCRTFDAAISAWLLMPLLPPPPLTPRRFSFSDTPYY